MKKLESQKIKPTHNVKFIAFAGEEWAMRGSKDYIKKHVFSGEEKIKYVFNPGNFGHKDRYKEKTSNNNVKKDKEPIKFILGSDDDYSRNEAFNIIDRVRKEFNYPLEIDKDNSITGEDGELFRKSGTVFQFSRWPYKGYHRKTDNIDMLDTELFKIECEMVWEVVYHYLYEKS